MKVIRVYSAIIGILFLCLTLFPGISFAHAYIVESSPIENEVLKSAPREVTIQFDESIQSKFNSIKVTNSNGKQVDLKNGGLDPKQPSILRVGLKKNIPNGIYRVQWKAISKDGHPVKGVIPFQVGSGSAGDSSAIANEKVDYIPKPDLVIIRWLQYIGNASLVGLFFFFMLIAPKKQKSIEKAMFKFIWVAFLLLALSIVVSLPLQATIVLGNKWSEVLSFDALEQVLAYTIFGRFWLIQMAILLTLALTTHFLSMADSTKNLFAWVSLGLGMGLLFTKTMTSHASAQANNVLAVTMDFLHLSAASIWIGCIFALVILLPLLKAEETKHIYIKMVKRFTNSAIMLVLLLTATGIFGAFQYIPTVSSIFHTDYGKVLVAKVGLFILMLLFAFLNFLKGRKGVAKGIKATLGGELITGIIILILTVFLTNLPTAMTSPGPFMETNLGDQGYSVTFVVTPNSIGENTYQVFLKNKIGQPIINVEQVNLTFNHVEMDMGKDTITLEKLGDGKFEAKGLNLNMSGKWNVQVHVLTKELDSIDTDFTWFVGSKK